MKKLILIILLLAACQDSIQGLEEAKNVIESLKPAQKELQTQASQELEKVYTYEYKVVEFPISNTVTSLQSDLEELGKERWDCFSTTVVEQKIRVFCKRKPKSYLNYVPRVF